MTKKSEDEIDDVWEVSQWLKCPSCHRTGTTSLTMHPDGDVTFYCDACTAMAFGHKLHQSDRVYDD